MQKSFTFIDLFAGIGGCRMALENTGGECLFTSEINKFAIKTYKANFSCDHQIVGDIKNIKETDIPKHDFLIAGFPCQPFSIAGVSKNNSLDRPHGFLDQTKGTLFFEIVRILKHHLPKVFILENVKNLTRHDKGNTFDIIKNTLTIDLPYNISYQIIDGKRYVPQHRERIYIIGIRKDLGIKPDFNFPLPSDGKTKLKDILFDNSTVDKKYVLSDKLWQYLQLYSEKHKNKGNGFGFSLVSEADTSRTLSARYGKDGSEILIHRGNLKNPRRLTPRECARLMGFPDEFKIPVSDAQAYIQFGNSVVVPLLTDIAKHVSNLVGFHNSY